MDLNKYLPRNAARSFTLGSSEGPITAICTCGNFAEIYTVDKTFRIQSPDGIDPEKTNPNAPWVTTPVRNVGSRSLIISRLFLQGVEMLKAACFEKNIDNAEIITLLHSCKESLLECDRIAKKINEQTNAIIEEVKTQGIEVDDHGGGITSFPHISELESECTNFLIQANRLIKTISGLPAKFQLVPKPDSNFEHLANHLKASVGGNTPLVQFVTMYVNEVKHIVDLRNYQEHPDVKKTIIENFRCTPQMEIVIPQWYITGEAAVAIHEEMKEIVEFLTELTEAMLIHLIMACVKKELPYALERIEAAKIDPDKPIKYKLTLDVSKLQLQT